MALIKICVLFLTIIILSEAKDGEINVYVSKSNLEHCHTKSKNYYSYIENNHVVIHSFHDVFINYAWIELPKMQLHFDPNLETVELSLHPSMKGNWTFVYLYLINMSDYKYIDGNNYTRGTCTIHVNIDADNDLPKKILFPALISVSALALLLLITVIMLTICLKRKAHQKTDRFRLLTMKKQDNEDPDRYSTTPVQKKSMKLAQPEPVAEERDSCIYENPETCLSALRHQTSIAPPILPNTPRPVHPDIISKGAGSAVHSASTLKLTGSKSPHPTLPRTKNEEIDSSKAFLHEASQIALRSPFTTSTINLNTVRNTTNPQHTTFPRPKQMQNGKSDTLPALPLPTEEVYEEMESDESEIYEELPDVEVSRSNSRNKPKIPGGMTINGQDTRKPAKPPVSEKPKGLTGPINFPVKELNEAFKQRNTNTAPTKKNGPTKSMQVNSALPITALTPFRPKAATTSGPRPNLQINNPDMISEEQSHPAQFENPFAPVNHSSKPVVLPVIEAIYNNEEGNSSEEEWTYEPLKPDRYYRK